MSDTPPVVEQLDNLPTDQLPTIAKEATFQQLSIYSSSRNSCADSPTVVDYEMPNFFKDNYKTVHSFLMREELCDLEILCGKKSFKCHRIILACISGYFKTMFVGTMVESKQAVVKIQDIDENVMENIIKYAYSGKITINIENVQSILHVSSILQIENVADICCEFMKEHLHRDNCVQVHEFAMLHNREQLIKYSRNFITENFLEMSNTPDFLTMSESVIDSLVSSNYLNVSKEAEVFEAVMLWINHDLKNREKCLPHLIGKIKLPMMETCYLMERVATSEIVRNSMACRDFLDEAKNYHMYLANLVPEMRISERTRPRKGYAGVLFCVGGRGSSGDPYKTVECYHPMKDHWYPVSEMHTRRRHVGVCCLEGEIYAVGGHNGNKHLSTGEVFDPSTAKWRKIASMVTQRTGIRGLGLASLGGAVYAVGGLDDKTCFDIVERYNPKENSWTQVAPMNLPRGGVGVAALKDHLYAIGGNDGSSSLKKCESYDPYINKWTHMSNMDNKRAGAGVAVLDGCIYAVGGFDDNASLDTCERYDPRVGKYMSVAKLSCARGGVGVASLGGKLYAVGGHDGCNYLNSVESFDPLTNSWENLNDMNFGRAGAGLTGCPLSMSDFHQLRKQTSPSQEGPL